MQCVLRGVVKRGTGWTAAGWWMAKLNQEVMIMDNREHEGWKGYAADGKMACLTS